MRHTNDNDPGHRYCFLCMEEIPDDQRSEEHVIPRWMQRDFDLMHQKLTLVNGSGISYKRLKLPCCRECNNVHLGRMEESFQHFVYKDWKPISNVPDLLVMQWCAKVLFSILYKEHSLPLRIEDPSGPRIWGNEVIDIYADLSLFLQSLRFPTDFNCRATSLPASIYKFDIVWSRAIPMEEHYDLIGIADGRGIAVRIKSRGYIVIFDGGLQQAYPDSRLQAVEGQALDPLQFREVVAYLFDRAARCRAHHGYLSLFGKKEASINQRGPYIGDAKIEITAESLIFEDEDFPAFAKLAGKLLVFDIDDQMLQNESYPSYLFSPDGRLKKTKVSDDGMFVPA
ncbi:HNH endonuclease [Rhizobium sp. BK176]|uniref:HNH endonuclease n=1 Tax=Rhizobium sp. BK176 TaxID=2587071 RepID=UPI00216A1184|nr:HNH endonuclease [Rhizobium sp. BK176]MCS4089786.1 hypothetical protein [Rhizobium sp. BK176]